MAYEKVVAGIARARQTLGEDKVSALMTTSVSALDYPKEIVDAYRENGFRSIFIRALNPYGLATENNDWEAYTTRFIEFYKQKRVVVHGIFLADFTEQMRQIACRSHFHHQTGRCLV